MSTYQGRKNVHGKAGVRFKTPWNATREKAMQRNIATELILHEKIIVTSGVVKKLIKNIDHLITLAKKNTLSSRRRAISFLRNEKKNNESAVKKLFEKIGPRFSNCHGGYTRKFKYFNRRGDGAKRVVIVFSK